MAGNKLTGILRPMLAREVDRAFSDNDWIYELKYDGFRAIAEVNGKKVRLYSRNGNSFVESYPRIVETLAALKIDAVLDGEIIALDESGRSSFQKLQLYKSDPTPPLEFRVFDLLFLDGKNICSLPLTDRKKKLKKLLPENGIVKYSEHIVADGEQFFDAACKLDLEGIIAKEADSEYFPGVRTNAWLKIKNHKSADAVIAGFTEPTGSRKYFGSLILGCYENGQLRYIGHTGSGFDQRTLKELHTKLSKLVTGDSPFSGRIKTNTPATWVRPVMVAEIKHSEWTRDGMLRHPIFLRTRNDKHPKEVTMQTNKPAPAVKTKNSAERTAKKSMATKKAATRKKPAGNSKKGDDFLKVGSHRVRVTNLDKVFWPEEGFTKGDVIDYYLQVQKYILPYLKNRPQSLKRNPNGVKDRGFFHKDAGEEAPSFVKSEPIYSEGAQKTIDYIVCNNAATLVYMNNLGCIEINPWHSTIRKQDHPDYMIMDIDPSDKNTFDQVVETAHVIHDILARAGAASFCKTSGASGIHVYVPCQKKYDYEQVKDFAQLIALLTVEQLPRFTTIERNLKKRGDKRIYVDFLQNRRGQTISSVYSLRPKPGATVSMPLAWKEVKPGIKPADFHIGNSLQRIKKTGDIFGGVLGKGIDLKKCLKKLGGG